MLLWIIFAEVALGYTGIFTENLTTVLVSMTTLTLTLAYASVEDWLPGK
jgi:hypothetical protein